MLYVQYITNEKKFPIWDVTLLDPMVYFIKGRIRPVKNSNSTPNYKFSYKNISQIPYRESLICT